MYPKLKPISGTAKPFPTTSTSPDSKQTLTKRSRVRTKLIAAKKRASIIEFEASISKRAATPTGDGEPRPCTTNSAPDNERKDTGVSPVARQVNIYVYVIVHVCMREVVSPQCLLSIHVLFDLLVCVCVCRW